MVLVDKLECVLVFTPNARVARNRATAIYSVYVRMEEPWRKRNNMSERASGVGWWQSDRKYEQGE